MVCTKIFHKYAKITMTARKSVKNTSILMRELIKSDVFFTDFLAVMVIFAYSWKMFIHTMCVKIYWLEIKLDGSFELQTEDA